MSLLFVTEPMQARFAWAESPKFSIWRLMDLAELVVLLDTVNMWLVKNRRVLNSTFRLLRYDSGVTLGVQKWFLVYVFSPRIFAELSVDRCRAYS